MEKNKKRKRINNRSGFTLMELLAVICIMAILLMIAVPFVLKNIHNSKIRSVTVSIDSYIKTLSGSVNALDYNFTAENTIFAIPIECIELEQGGEMAIGQWLQANNKYWAYVLVQYDYTEPSYSYAFTFKDSSGYGLYPTSGDLIRENDNMIQLNLELTKPETGLYTNFVSEENWSNSGFKLNSTTQLKVLEAESKHKYGDGVDTCTLCQVGSNYEQVEEEKLIKQEELEPTEGTLINTGTSSNNVFGKEMNKSNIESITIMDNKQGARNAIEWWDASVEKNLSIKAWILDEDENGKYELYIGQKDGVTAPTDSSSLFYGYSYAKKVDVKKLNTSNVTNMYMMFTLNAAQDLDLSTWDTSKVTNMQGMFGFTNFNSLNVSNFNTSNVTNMTSMFGLSQGVKSIDLRHFDTRKVTSMKGMFLSSGFEIINLSGWNTANVTDMANMFYGTKAKTLNLSHFNTAKVTDMSGMFFSASNLTSVNLSNWNTSNVTNMQDMFWATEKLASLNISSFNTSKVTNMANMFRESAIGTLNLGSNFNTSKVTDMTWMFLESPNINTTITLRRQTASSINMMFWDAATSSTARINVYADSSSYSAVSDEIYITKYDTANEKVYLKGRVS